MGMIFRMAAAAGLTAASVGGALAADSADEAWVENRSEPTLCAEFDNVYYTFANPKVARFRIEASAPVYLNDMKEDSTGPDFTHCDAMKDDPKNRFTPKKVTLYEDDTFRVVGHTYAESWRAKGAEVVVGNTDESDLHLVQLFEKVDGEFYEYLVVYPFDGYWRAKPIPTERFPNAAYGTSFLVGPIEVQHRPIVDISRLEIDPKARTFRMTFARGGSGELKVVGADREKIAMEVRLQGLPTVEPKKTEAGRIPAPPPFAGIRSMFVTPTNADTARINWKTDTGLYNEPVMTFKGANAREVRFDRIELSRHNTSAPDVAFRDFAGPAPR